MTGEKWVCATKHCFKTCKKNIDLKFTGSQLETSTQAGWRTELTVSEKEVVGDIMGYYGFYCCPQSDTFISGFRKSEELEAVQA